MANGWSSGARATGRPQCKRQQSSTLAIWNAIAKRYKLAGRALNHTAYVTQPDHACESGCDAFTLARIAGHIRSRLLSGIAIRRLMPSRERSENSQVGTNLGTIAI